MGLVVDSAGVSPNLHVSAAETTTVNGPSVDFEDAVEAVVMLDITAASGTTPTLDVVVQESVDEVRWTDFDTFAQQTGTGQTQRKISGFARYLRAEITIGGTTPSFTFQMKCSAKN